MFTLLDITLLFLVLAIITLMVLFIISFISGRTKSRYEVGGGIKLGTDTGSWLRDRDVKRRELLKDWDIKLLNSLSKSGEYTLDEIIAYLQESSPTISERLNRLEANGLIMKTKTGSIIITEKGRRYIDSIKERLWYRRREKELLDKK
ncbi:MAG: ArsR family transcriptional regulator [Staphylothermus sp.]|nr:ArsR family transcriptional regulator [Staphylothermus sp.]